MSIIQPPKPITFKGPNGAIVVLKPCKVHFERASAGNAKDKCAFCGDMTCRCLACIDILKGGQPRIYWICDSCFETIHMMNTQPTGD